MTRLGNRGSESPVSANVQPYIYDEPTMEGYTGSHATMPVRKPDLKRKLVVVGDGEQLLLQQWRAWTLTRFGLVFVGIGQVDAGKHVF
jgi:hypothetical protein